MIKFAAVDSTGSVAYTISPSTVDAYQEGQQLGGYVIRVLPDNADELEVITLWYYKDTWKKRPEKPSDFHFWDNRQEVWVEDTKEARERVRLQIEAVRDKRIEHPIEVQGNLFDGFKATQDNLKAKLVELEARVAYNVPTPAELLVWRDVENVTHSWETPEAYKEFLAMFSIALSERGTKEYILAWERKAVLNSLTTVAEILEFSKTVG